LRIQQIAFRFSVVYLALYSLATQFFGGVFLLPGIQVPALGTIWPMRDITLWLAEHVFGAAPPLIYIGNSGDTLFHWVQTAWLLVAAAVATIGWTAWDRTADDPAVAKWFRLYVRFVVAAQMFYYGMAKIIPTQFQAPSLVTLVQPVGTLGLADMLWTFIGASLPYQMFTGFAELIAGILLLIPRTTPLGALIALVDMIQVFLLNMTYDFGLKQISFHLILLSLFLLAPDFTRIANVVVLNRAADAAREQPLFRRAQANRYALIAQVVVGIYLMAMFANLSRGYYYSQGDGRPRSPLYGIWDVEELSVDGEVRPVVLNDYDRRWRRMIFDTPEIMVMQRTDDSFAHYPVAINERYRTLSVRKGSSRNWEAAFLFERPADDRLVIEGTMDGYKLRATLKRVELDSFRLRSSFFRWVRPPDPYAG
jgi:uncharacterized membrane protein YphA (DoxX/SURF4 family)